MGSIWTNLSTGLRPFLVLTAFLAVIGAIGLQFPVSFQGGISDTYPKGFRGGTCTIGSESLVIGYSGYFIPEDYGIPENAISAASIPVWCGKIPGPGRVNVTIDLLYPEFSREWPLSMRLAKMEGGTPSKTLMTMSSEVYEAGTIMQVLHIGEIGKYRLYLSGKDENQAEFALKIPITVGRPWYPGAAQFWPVLIAVVATIVFYIFRKR
jgi:hypothetical protein